MSDDGGADALPPLERLVAIGEIERLKFRYCRCIDLKEFDGLLEVLTDDAVAEYSGGKYRFEGRDAIIDFLRRNLGREQFHTLHHMHHPEITFVDATHASGIWAMNDVNLDPEWDFFLQGAGYYADEYRLTGEGWRISRTGYRRTFEVVESFDGAKRNLTASLWATGGRSSLDAS